MRYLVRIFIPLSILYVNVISMVAPMKHQQFIGLNTIFKETSLLCDYLLGGRGYVLTITPQECLYKCIMVSTYTHVFILHYVSLLNRVCAGLQPAS